MDAKKRNDNIVFMGCTCHIVRNTAKKDMDVFSKINHFIIEELLVDIFFNFGYSPKLKNLFTESCGFYDKDYGKILKLHRICCLSMVICIERVIFLSLTS